MHYKNLLKTIGILRVREQPGCWKLVLQSSIALYFWVLVFGTPVVSKYDFHVSFLMFVPVVN